MGKCLGEVVELDDRGRVTIPSELRKTLPGTRVRVERGDDNTILIRPELSSEAVLKAIKAVKLRGESRRAKYDASSVKDRYGGLKD